MEFQIIGQSAICKLKEISSANNSGETLVINAKRNCNIYISSLQNNMKK
jgi:hypothetical protein